MTIAVNILVIIFLITNVQWYFLHKSAVADLHRQTIEHAIFCYSVYNVEELGGFENAYKEQQRLLETMEPYDQTFIRWDNRIENIVPEETWELIKDFIIL